MSKAPARVEEDGISHPRETAVLFGHAEAEQTLLDAYRSGSMPHAWLIDGPAGIGKATLAYRMARFVFAHPDPAAEAVQRAASLAVPLEHPAVHRVAAQAHPDLLVLQRTESDSGTLRTVIVVDDTRRTIKFFGSTAGEGGWRICIVDTADELNGASANALLKVIEEPPARTLFLILSHTPGRLLPTIRSRCRRLSLRALSPEHTLQALAAAAPETEADERAEAAAEADGSVARALSLLDDRARRLRKQVSGMLAKLPSVDPLAMHVLGDQLAGTDPAPLAAFLDAVRQWLSAQLQTAAGDQRRLARFAQVWEKVGAAARDVEIYNLERKPLVFAVFESLSEAARA